jgi:hypothetical protein
MRNSQNDRRRGIVIAMLVALLVGIALAAARADDNHQVESKVWRETSRCGVNSMYLALKLLHRQVSYDAIEERMPIKENGTRLTDMRNCAESFGIDAQIVHATPATLQKCWLPAVAHCEEEQHITGHYVVVVRAAPDEVDIIDGTTGILHTVSMVEFGKEWSGYLLLLSPRPMTQWLFQAAAACGGLIAFLVLGIWVVTSVRGRARLARGARDTDGHSEYAFDGSMP